MPRHVIAPDAREAIRTAARGKRHHQPYRLGRKVVLSECDKGQASGGRSTAAREGQEKMLHLDGDGQRHQDRGKAGAHAAGRESGSRPTTGGVG